MPNDKLLEVLRYWIVERQKVRVAKISGHPKPWTQDEILQKYRFCNVIRMHDKVSCWLMENWYDKYHGHENMAFACCMARQINWPGTLFEVGFPFAWQPHTVAAVMEVRQARGDKVYTGAYMLTGTLGGPKVGQTVHKILDPLFRNFPAIDTSSMQNTHKMLAKGGFKGFSSFMAGQAVADMRWAVPGTWGDRWSWAPLGPGSRRGLNRLFGRAVEAPLKAVQAIGEMQDLFARVSDVLPEEAELMDLQNCLCEFDKYMRVLNGEGRPRSTYPGV